MSDYLFLVTIGPVQDFIAAARRTRDLWFGSWFLSELSRAAAQKIVELHGPDALIFPHPQAIASPSQTDTSDLSQRSAKVANKILAHVQTYDVAQTGETIQAAVRACLLELRDAAFDSVKDWSQGDKDLAEQQIDSLIECYWAAVSFEANGDYKTQRSLLEEIMAARKSTRHFTQVDLSPTQQRYPKSSLDGLRESVIRESTYPNRNDTPLERRTKLLNLFRTFGAKQAERLSGVDLLKRRGNHRADEADFPSTSHFAALPFLEKINTGSTTIRDAFSKYRSLLSQVSEKPEILAENYQKYLPSIEGYDASILFEARLAEEVERADLDFARGALQEFFDAVASMLRPKPYYAILQADGDSMGKVIDNQLSVESHQALSNQLAKFATQAESIVQEHRGALVYAGGDDVLALLPINTALHCAKQLHDEFDRAVGKDFKGKDENPQFVSDKNIPATLSVGIAICHHLEPLNDALALVRGAEKAAKQVDGKNGLAIAIAKRSGEPQRIQGSWAGEDDFFARLQVWLRLMGDTELSAGAPYELRDLTVRLGEPKELEPEHQSHHRAIAEEAGRIIERKQGQRGTKKLASTEITALREYLGLPKTEVVNKTVRFIVDEKGERYRKQKITVRKLADELIVARELVRLGAARLQEGENK